MIIDFQAYKETKKQRKKARALFSAFAYSVTLLSLLIALSGVESGIHLFVKIGVMYFTLAIGFVAFLMANSTMAYKKGDEGFIVIAYALLIVSCLILNLEKFM